MLHRRPRSPGSFQDELVNVIERVGQLPAKAVERPAIPLGAPKTDKSVEAPKAKQRRTNEIAD